MNKEVENGTMKNPTITITGIGRHWFNFAIKIPRENGETELKGAARSGEPIEIPINENEHEANDTK